MEEKRLAMSVGQAGCQIPLYTATSPAWPGTHTSTVSVTGHYLPGQSTHIHTWQLIVTNQGRLTLDHTPGILRLKHTAECPSMAAVCRAEHSPALPPVAWLIPGHADIRAGYLILRDGKVLLLLLFFFSFSFFF